MWMSAAMRHAVGWVEQGLIPDAVTRKAIRRLLRQRLEEIQAADCEAGARMEGAIVSAMDRSPVALVPELANAQHYEVPSDFFAQVLGPHRKYSSCYWPEGTTQLVEAEAAALALTCEHADLEDGQSILELGCGWGSLTLWMARQYPSARITAVSNSRSQREHIEAEARKAGCRNVRVLTADMNDFGTQERFDRVVSVEMFEHMRNWRLLLERIHGWLHPGGRFLMHVFCHRSTPYFFEDEGPTDWMSRHFFSGGLMPSDSLPLRFQEHLRLVDRWRWGGQHYERTLNAWLATMDAKRAAVLPILARTYGPEQTELWWHRWRIFFMACAELFGYDGGQQWWVSHYLFERPQDRL
jgi:cyclopropane-fatty-acyl-phospholipid synthase